LNPFSSGFGVESSEDSMVAVDNGTKRRLICGTEKGRHKCKNYRTAGIFVVKWVKPQNNLIRQSNFSFILYHLQYFIISYSME